MRLGEKCAARDLQLGDTVQIETIRGFGTAVVSGISDEYVELFRPYVAFADFECAGTRVGTNGRTVITYTGTETWQEGRNDSHPRFTLCDRRSFK